ncbi:glutathione S-transferase family protein [Sandarakinorhabdus glacialis]|nr:glutathione S-transferase N-terminal domain-containing protein [Polymorphobacter glacialis]
MPSPPEIPHPAAMQLLASLTSPYARRLRILIAELGLDIPVVPTAPMDNPAALLTANPLGKVPALVLGEGTAIVDSPVIAAWLLARSPTQTLMPTTGTAHWHARTTEALTDGILDAAIILRFNTGQGVTSGVWTDRQYAAIDRTLAALPARIGASPYEDICIVIACEYLDLRFAAIDWRTTQPALAALQSRLTDTPALIATRPPQ